MGEDVGTPHSRQGEYPCTPFPDYALEILGEEPVAGLGVGVREVPAQRVAEAGGGEILVQFIGADEAQFLDPGVCLAA